MPQLDATHLKYIDGLWRDLREANHNTRKLDAQWNRINDELNDYLDRKGETDIVQRAKTKGESLALADALGAGNWWRAKAVWLAQAILAEKAAMEMTQGGVVWDKPQHIST